MCTRVGVTARRTEECNMHSVSVARRRQTSFTVTLHKWKADNYKLKINASCGSIWGTFTLANFHNPGSTVDTRNIRHEFRSSGMLLCRWGGVSMTFRRDELPSFHPSTVGRGRLYFPSKRQETLTTWHGVKSHKTRILNKTALETQISHIS